MSLTELTGHADKAAVLAAVEDFARRSVLSVVEPPEKALSAAELASLDEAATRVGILPIAGEPGYGLWEASGALDMSLGTLEHLAKVSAGVAFRFHVAALAQRIAERIGAPSAGSVIAVEGPAGLGKGALARILSGNPVDEETARNIFPLEGAAVRCFAGGPAERILYPRWRGGIEWVSVPAADAAFVPEAHPHGLSEAGLSTLRVAAVGDAHPVERPMEPLVTYWGAFSLGCVAVALGAVRHALDKALEYAGLRRQGGHLLEEHAAIRLLLADAAVAIGAAESMLRSIDALPTEPRGLKRIFEVRAAAQPLLNAAANQCLQVFGGYGYMQDYGMEKIVRDCNALRLVGGTTTELKLFIAEQEVTACR